MPTPRTLLIGLMLGLAACGPGNPPVARAPGPPPQAVRAVVVTNNVVAIGTPSTRAVALVDSAADARSITAALAAPHGPTAIAPREPGAPTRSDSPAGVAETLRAQTLAQAETGPRNSAMPTRGEPGKTPADKARPDAQPSKPGGAPPAQPTRPGGTPAEAGRAKATATPATSPTPTLRSATLPRRGSEITTRPLRAVTADHTVDPRGFLRPDSVTPAPPRVTFPTPTVPLPTEELLDREDRGTP
jgi:hypothetical protein